MAEVYGQNCGSYKIDYFPKYSFFAFSISGVNKDPNGNTYTDVGTLKSGTADDVGRYTVTMVTYQDKNDPTNGFSSPYRGAMPDATQTFTITITPCVVASYNSVAVQGDISYRIGDPNKT